MLMSLVLMVSGIMLSAGPVSGTVVAWGRGWEGETNVPPGLTNVIAIAAGSYHCLALQDDGTVVAWGDNGFGQTNVPAGLTGVVAISAGEWHSLALKADGTVVAWGAVNTPPAAPVDFGQAVVPAGLSNVVAIAAGAVHSLALKADGSVVAWGHSAFNVPSAVPPDLSNAVAIAAGGVSLAIRSDGTIRVWNPFGDSQGYTQAGLSNVAAVAAGTYYALALQADGLVTVWGSPFNGETDVPAGLSNVIAVAGGDNQGLALQSDGSIAAWGQSGFGEGSVPPGLSNVIAIAAGGQHNLALVGDGSPAILGPTLSRRAYTGDTVVMNARAVGTPPLGFQWLHQGTNLPGATNLFLNLPNVQPGQDGTYSVVASNSIGIATATNTILTLLSSAPIIDLQPADQHAYPGGPATFPVVLEGSMPFQYQWLFNGQELPGATNSTLALNAVRFSQAGGYSVRVSNSLGSVVSSTAQLDIPPIVAWGDYTDGAPDSQRFPAFAPSGLGNVVALAGGYAHSLALTSDGRVIAWGVETVGYKIDTRFGQTNVPPDLSNVVAITAGDFDSFALKSDGTITAWGSDADGQIDVPPALTNLVTMTAGYNTGTTFALRRDGTVAVIGGAYAGVLTNVPAGLRNVVALAAGWAQCVALKADSTVAAWGVPPLSTVPDGLTNVVAIAAGFSSSLALKADGTVVAWGFYTNVPPGLTNVVAIAAAGDQTLALKADGTVVAWGGFIHPPLGLTNVIAIAAGPEHGLALVADRPPPALLPTLRLTAQAFNQQGFSLSMPSPPGKVLGLEFEDSLANTNWNALPLVLGDGALKLFLDPTPAATQRFYRVRQWP